VLPHSHLRQLTAAPGAAYCNFSAGGQKRWFSDPPAPKDACSLDAFSLKAGNGSTLPLAHLVLQFFYRAIIFVFGLFVNNTKHTLYFLHTVITTGTFVYPPGKYTSNRIQGGTRNSNVFTVQNNFFGGNCDQSADEQVLVVNFISV